jgi:hypothetical protein
MKPEPDPCRKKSGPTHPYLKVTLTDNDDLCILTPFLIDVYGFSLQTSFVTDVYGLRLQISDVSPKIEYEHEEFLF